MLRTPEVVAPAQDVGYVTAPHAPFSPDTNGVFAVPGTVVYLTETARSLPPRRFTFRVEG